MLSCEQVDRGIRARSNGLRRTQAIATIANRRSSTKCEVIVSRNRTCLVFAVIALLGPFAALPASAQTFDERVFFTFSAPVELPGVVLPQGKYIFRLPDATATRNVVQVLSGDGRKSHGIFFTLGADRPDPAPQPEIRFMETAAGTPPAIRAYWNVGQTRGHEFIYPKEQAKRLVKTSKAPVLTTAAQTTTADQTNTASIVRLSADGTESAVNPGSTPVRSPATGTSQQGETAPESIEIPRVVVVVAVPNGR
jgi:hypothetical protein